MGYDEKKFSELILYISQKCAEDPSFGSTKLNKILYFSDFLAYGRWGTPITGAEYQHLPHGPAPRALFPVRNAMKERGDVAVEERKLLSGKTLVRTVALRDPDLSAFSALEISLVDSLITALWGENAITVSDLSHRLVGWKSTHHGETIPYGTVFLSDEPLSLEERRRGREIWFNRMHANARCA